MKGIKLLFADIDGVLNTTDYSIVNNKFAIEMHSPLLAHDKHGDLFDPRAVKWLEWIIYKTKADIVISSTWRNRGIDKLRDMWYDRKLPGYVIDITPKFHGKLRGEEIKAFLEDGEHRHLYMHEFNVDSYCIIDDDTDMLPEQKDNFVHCDDLFGITKEKAEEAISILNKNNPK
jgi:hypothetical protein